MNAGHGQPAAGDSTSEQKRAQLERATTLPASSKLNRDNGWNAKLAKCFGWAVDDPVNASRNCSNVFTSVRALTPFPANPAAERQLFYFEVDVKMLRANHLWMSIGLAHDFPLSGQKVGQLRYSFAVSNWGNLLEESFERRNDQMGWWHGGTVVGCGLEDVPGKGRRLFFTLNGQLDHEPIKLTARQASRELYPTVSTFNAAIIEANFGKKPFQFDCNSWKWNAAQKTPTQKTPTQKTPTQKTPTQRLRYPPS